MQNQRPFLRLSPFLRMTDGGGDGGGSATGKQAGDDGKGGDGKGGDDGKSGGAGDKAGSDGKTDDEPLGEPGKRALVRERERADAAERALTEAKAKLKEHEDAELTDQQKAARDLQEARTEAEEAKGELLRYQVADEKELPAGWASRLQGSTREELERDADVLKTQLGTARQPLKPDLSQGRGGGGDDGKKKGSVSAGADLHAELHSKK